MIDGCFKLDFSHMPNNINNIEIRKKNCNKIIEINIKIQSYFAMDYTQVCVIKSVIRFYC